jgi:putative SOS response-associated peptidase YedK
MCGRYQFSPNQDFYDRYSLLPSGLNLSAASIFTPQSTGVVLTGESSCLKINLMTWGLIPSWSKDPSISRHTFNARSETVAVKPAFRQAFQSQRCLIPANAFFEWQPTGQKPKVPYRISIPNQPVFSLGGIFDYWRDPSQKIWTTYSIITVPANSSLEPIHPRMPLIINQSDEAVWLNPESASSSLVNLFRPYPSAAVKLEKL